MVEYVRGDKLPAPLQRQVLAAYVYRFTGDNRPAWTREPRPCGNPYPLQFRDDADWLANTRFPVNKAGQLADNPSSCESSPTWPNNPELRRA